MDSININTDTDTRNLSFSDNINKSTAPINIIKDDGHNIGAELLMNPNKISGGDKTSPVSLKPLENTVELNIDNFNISKDNEIDLNSLLATNDSLKMTDMKFDEVTLDDNVFKIPDENRNVTISSSPSYNNSDNHVKMEPINDNVFNTLPTEFSSSSTSYEDRKKEKFDLLCNLERLEKKGIRLSKTFTMDSEYEEMKREFERINNGREIDRSVRFQRKMLVACVTAIEFLNNKFDPADVKLEGWSESVHENLDDYDDIFEELHAKYKSKASLPPEMRLLLMLGGSGFMFHLTQTLFKSSLPGVGDIMKQNPDLMRQFASAAASSMKTTEPGLGNLMGDLMGGGGQPNERNNNNNNNNNTRNYTQRPEMRGPPNLDDILNNVNSGNNNNNNINIDAASNYSESDIDNVRGVEIRRRNNKKNKREITLDL
jgi:hypothetical protein